MSQRSKNKNGRIVTAFATCEAGPGWANSPLWLIIEDEDGKLRQEALQPDEQSREIQTLFQISAAVHQNLLSALRHSVLPMRIRVRN